jgi:deoxyribose-phosphate aldolase
LTNETIHPEGNVRPALAVYEELARMIDYAALAPEFSEEQISQACDVAKKYRVARLTVRPSDLDMAAAWMKGSGTAIATTVGYPHGSETTAAKLYAVRDALQRGARAIETVLNRGKLASRQFRYLESELMQMAQECRRAGAELIVDFEVGLLPEDLRVIACKIAKRADVHWVRGGSLYGTGGHAEEDLQFLGARLGDVVQLDAGSAVRTLHDALRAHEIGCAGFQTTDPGAILDAWNAELKRREADLAQRTQKSAENAETPS